MISLDKAVVARLAKSGEKFEILVDPVKAHAFRKNQNVKIDEIIAYPGIFKDSRKAEKASEDVMQKLFGTTDAMKIAEKILREGEIQLTTEQRKSMVEDKRIQIANIISRNAINPQTNAPHPPQRILNAIEEVGILIDPLQPAEEQVEKVVKEIKIQLPIKIETIQIAIKIPAQYSGKSTAVIRGMANVKKEEWSQSGDYICLIEVPAGLSVETLEKLNKITGGQVESKIIRKESGLT